MWRPDDLDTANARLAAAAATAAPPWPARTRPEAPAPRRLRVLTPAECAGSARREYILKGLAVLKDVVVVVGQPGAGKSVLVPYLAWRIAQGERAFGRRVRRAAVLYVAAEDGTGMQMRVSALRETYGEASGFFLVPDAPDLMDPTGTDLAELVRVARERRAGLIVLDTLARAFPGLRENEAEDMDRVVRACRGLANETGAAVMLLHHPAKAEGSETPRGHGRLDGDADVTLFVAKGGEGERIVKMGKNRNGASEARFTFGIRTVALGIDPDGDPITAPVAEELSGGSGKSRPRLSPTERRAHDMLATVIAVEGMALPRGTLFPTVLRGVPERRWREECSTRRLSPTDTAEAQRKAFDRGFKSLLEKRVVAARDGLVWIACHPADGHGQETDTSEPVQPGNPGGATDGHGHPP